MRPTFQVLVAGTMNTGKTTLLNAMLGHDLLPAAASSHTALPFCVDYAPASTTLRCRAKDGHTTTRWRKASTQLLKTYIERNDLCSVEVRADMPFLNGIPAVDVRIVDLPPLDNAHETRHGDIAHTWLENARCELLLFMLATEHQTCNGEKDNLVRICTTLRDRPAGQRPEVRFVLNKIDRYDPEKPDHDPAASVATYKRFLTGCGFQAPRVICTATEPARLLRALDAGVTLGTRDRRRVASHSGAPTMRGFDLLTLSDYPDSVRRRLNDFRDTNSNQMPGFLRQILNTGVPGLEACILHSIEKSLRRNLKNTAHNNSA